MAIYQNPQSELIREPNLLVPGKKPVGSVKIDSSHPLANKLRFDCDFNFVNPRDRVTNKLLTASGTPTLDANANGRYILFNKATPDYYTFNGTADWEGNDSVVELIARIDSHDSSGSMAVSWNDNGSFYCQIGNANKFFIFNVNIAFNTVDPDDSVWHHYIFGGFTDIPTYMRGYVDGIDDTGNPVVGKVNLPTGAKTLYFGKYVGGASWDWDGGISLIRLWNNISTRDAISLAKDPFQLYIPA